MQHLVALCRFAVLDRVADRGKAERLLLRQPDAQLVGGDRIGQVAEASSA